MITSTFNSNLRSKPDPTLALILNRAPALGQTLPLAVSPYRVRPNSGRNQQADGSWAWCDDDRMDLLTLEEVHGYSFRYKVKLYMLKHGCKQTVSMLVKCESVPTRCSLSLSHSQCGHYYILDDVRYGAQCQGKGLGHAT